VQASKRWRLITGAAPHHGVGIPGVPHADEDEEAARAQAIGSGHALAAIRQERGLSQQQIADAMGISLHGLIAIEEGNVSGERHDVVATIMRYRAAMKQAASS
jgi:DNA-binding XRE family transcriptional regulator